MWCDICSWTKNEDVQKFEKNSIIVLENLRKSEAGKSAEYWRAQLFPVLSAEEIKERDDAKAKLFEWGNAHLRKAHRLDLPS